MHSFQKKLYLSGEHSLAYRRSQELHEKTLQTGSFGVVFLHGLMSDMNGTKALFLEEHCRKNHYPFIRFDQTGHGASSGQFTDGTVGVWLRDTLAILDHLTTGPQVLVGSSMGGWIMLLAAEARPDRVAGLVGLAPAPDFTETLVWPQLTEVQKKRVENHGAVDLPCDYSPHPYTLTRNLFQDGRRHLVLNRPISFTGPVRVVHGQKDTDVPWQHSLELSARLATQDVTCTFLKDGDHRLSTPRALYEVGVALDSVMSALENQEEPSQVSCEPT